MSHHYFRAVDAAYGCFAFVPSLLLAALLALSFLGRMLAVLAGAGVASTAAEHVPPNAEHVDEVKFVIFLRVWLQLQLQCPASLYLVERA